MRYASLSHRLGVTLLTCTLPWLTIPALSEVVTVDEAVTVTQAWLQAEVNGPFSRLNETDRAEWSDRLADPRVYYLLANDVWAGEAKRADKVLAYIVAYEPGGFAVVTADDRLEPLPVFDAFSAVRDDNVPENFLRSFLAKNIPARWAHLRKQLETKRLGVHPDWTWLRAQLESSDPFGSDAWRGGSTLVELDTALWGQLWPYNTEVMTNNGNNNCPTGCTATAMAIQMRFHCWPPTGNGTYNYCDIWDLIQFCHAVNYGASNYNWANMPLGPLSQANADVAQLMYHCGVAVDMDYEVDASGAWPSAGRMNTHFRYKGTIDVHSANMEDHVSPARDSILASLPVVASSSAHTVLLCGYRDTVLDDRFFINTGWEGSSNGWYDLDEIPGGDPTLDHSCPHSSPDNYFFVDGAWSGTETGIHQEPYNTVSEGNAAVSAGGRLCIKGGNYTGVGNVPVTFDTSMTITSYEGTATIGN